MHPPFNIGLMACAKTEGIVAFEAFLQAGQPATLDLFSASNGVCVDERILEFLQAEKLSNMPARYGLRLTPQQALHPAAVAAVNKAGRLIFVCDDVSEEFVPHLRGWKAKGIELFWEYAPLAEPLFCMEFFDGVVVRGSESGGRSRGYSVRLLFEHARKRLPDAVIFVQGVMAPETAAVFVALGADGIILDTWPAAAVFSGCSEKDASGLSALLVSNLRRKHGADDWIDTGYALSCSDTSRELPLGPGMLLAEAHAADQPITWIAAFRQRTAAALGCLMEFSPENLLAAVSEPAFTQGPMAFLSCSVEFAKACAKAGFFPFFSLTALASSEIACLREAVLQAPALAEYGLGFAGQHGLDITALLAAFAPKPPAALLLSADQWPLLADFMASGIPVWLHVQKPEHALHAVAQGITNLVVEGSEAGGHVGCVPGAALWTMVFKALAGLGRSDINVVLAGGIADERAALFGLLLAKSCGFQGRITFQLGTALSASPEAVASGVAHAKYQHRLLCSRFTQVIGPGTGAGLRFVTNPSEQNPLPNALAHAPDAAQQVIASYRSALAGAEDALLLAGEVVLFIGEPITLAETAKKLASFQNAWREARALLKPRDALDFRVLRRQPVIDLAVVGAGGLFPGAPDLNAFWSNLFENRRSITEIPSEYWGAAEYYVPDYELVCQREAMLTYTRTAGRLEFFSFDALDCLKFRIPPLAAEVTDKTQLVLLKALDQALECAGPSLKLPKASTVVVVANSMGGENTRRSAVRARLADIENFLLRAPELAGLAPGQLAELIARLKTEIAVDAPPLTEDSMVGGSPGILAGRLAAFLGLHGGCYAVDAACAASLAGLATAVALMRSGQAEAAILGAVDCELSVDAFISFCKLRALSPGISKPYMQNSDGFTMGEGGGLLILKPLETALRDGDFVLARIVGLGLSADGEQGSMTLPQQHGQELAIRRCFEMSGFEPATIQYIEGHGTGTAAGDAVELATLARVFNGIDAGKIALGTVKSHIGHLKSAAGMASLIKTVLALKNKALPPAFIEGPQHPLLQRPDYPLRLLPEPAPWRREGFMPRRAAVSAFGFGGSNAHLHIEEMHDALRFISSSRLLLFSGRTREELAGRVAALDKAVRAAGTLDFADSRQMACMGGNASFRLAMAWNSTQPWTDAVAALANALTGSRAGEDVWFAERRESRPMAWLFPGQAASLEPSFRQQARTTPFLTDAIRAAESCINMQLLDVLWPVDAAPVELMFQARKPERQPATVALSLALAGMLKKLGLWPDAVAGHSLGFYSALAGAGALTQNAALNLVRQRADCFAALPPEQAGCMVALGIDEKAACALAAESPVPAHLANMNSPRQTVVAISQADAAEFFAFLDARGIEHKNVPVGWAFHSPLVEQAAAAFCAHLNANDFHRPVTPIYTERSGELVPPESFDRTFPDWLPLHILEPIRFDMLAAAMARDGIRVFLEIGAGGTLTRLIKDNLPNAGITAMTMDTSGADGMAHWNRVFARLYVEAGRTFDLGVYADIFAGQLRPARVNAEPGLGWTSTPAPEPAAKNMDITPAASAQQNDELHEKVRSLIARHTGFDKGVLSGNMALQEALGLDSLKMMELGLDLERAFGRPILVSALPRGLTLDGLVERIRSGEAFASSGAAAKQPRRWVLARRPLPPAPLLTPVSDSDARPVWLLTNDTELAAAWEKARMGETRILSRQATLPSPPDSFEATPRGIVLALRNSLLPQESWAQWDGALAFGHALGSRWLPALRKRLHGDNTHFQVITSVIGETDKLDAAWPALTLSMQREYPGFLCAHLRLEGRASAATALQRLCRELKVPEPRHPVVFSRKFARFTEHLEELAALPSANSINLQPDDAVLVTGGGRGITARIITSLATSLKPAWILAGSTPLDAGTPQAKARQMTAQTLRQAGCRVIEWVYDLSSESEALAMIERLGHEFPRLAGVIHGAGALADSMIEDKPLEDFLRVFRVKAWSALLLEKALDLSSLRFWINFGSLAAFLGNSGQTDYAAANAMLSAQAFRLRAAGVPLAKTILWSAWQGEGMAASEAMQSALKAAGVSAIEPEEGVRFFETELREPAATVVAFGGEPLGMAADLPMRADPVWAGYRAAGASLRMLTKSFLEAEPFLRDHRINGACVLPGVMALELSARLPQAGIGPLAWENVQFHRVLRATSGRLALALEWTALRAAAIEFSLREADAEDVAFSGTMRLHVFRRRSAQQPAIGPLKAELALGELYGSQGRLFSGPAFQALGQGACIYARAAKAALTAPATLFYSNGVAPVVPVAAVDACMQLAALWLLEHGHGPCLPASIAYAWWCGDAAVSGSCAACVWHKGKSADGHALFDATIMAGRRVCWVIKGLAMAAVEGAG